MSFENDNTNLKNEMPKFYTLGWLLIFVGSLPVIIALKNLNRAALIIGSILVVVGIVLAIIGKIQSVKMIKKAAGQKLAGK
ncbi:MAG: hypothetical protein JXB50_00695 [Spirochaetes bacterium]|nr:hypothetical protein [Spirochaetota bacterium]